MIKTVILGVTSGIAAYKSLELVNELKKEDLEVLVIMTDNATKMVASSEFEKASGNKVLTKLFEPGFDYKKVLETRIVDHIQIADKAAVMVIAPLTANTLAKITNGMADDFLTTTTLAVTAPIILCPSMNVNMWNNPLVQGNISKLKKLGHIIIEPEEGALACGYIGKGRLADIQKIKDEIMTQLSSTESLQDKKIIVTAGGTIEKIDDVRYIANRSSGKMGVALAQACYRRGADVLLLRAKSAIQPRFLIPEKTFSTADDLFELIQQNVKDCDVIFHAAAVSDFEVANQEYGKIASDQPTTITLQPRAKLLDEIKKINPNVTLIAFKAEHGLSEDKLINKAYERLLASNADAIIVNDVSKPDSGFEVDTNEVFVVLKNKEIKKIPNASKREIAEEIVSCLQDNIMIKNF